MLPIQDSRERKDPACHSSAEHSKGDGGWKRAAALHSWEGSGQHSPSVAHRCRHSLNGDAFPGLWSVHGGISCTTKLLRELILHVRFTVHEVDGGRARAPTTSHSI